MSEHRLIYADELLEVFEQYLDEMQYVEESISKSARLSLIKWVIDKTNEQPTAYDIDKVVSYIDRVANSGLGKSKSLEYIKKYVKAVRNESDNKRP